MRIVPNVHLIRIVHLRTPPLHVVRRLHRARERFRPHEFYKLPQDIGRRLAGECTDIEDTGF